MSAEAPDMRQSQDAPKKRKAKEKSAKDEKHRSKKTKHAGDNKAEEKDVKSKNSTRPRLSKQPAQSHLSKQSTSFYVGLSPVYQQASLEGLCAEHFSPLLLTYYPPLRGIVLAYSNLRSGQHADDTGELGMSQVIDEYGVTFSWLTADFLVFRPQIGAVMEGHVTVQSESYIGLVCWNLFNATISEDQLPRGWSWVAAANGKMAGAHAQGGANEDDDDYEGHYVDAEGNDVSGKLEFRVVDFESFQTQSRDSSFISIQGTLLSEKEQEKRGPGRRRITAGKR